MSELSSDPPEDSIGIWVLKRRHEDLSEMFRSVWDFYIKFYTVFLTLSVAAMGWLFTRNSPNARFSHVLAGVFIGQSLLTAITSIFMAEFSRRAGQTHEDLEKEMLSWLELRREHVLSKTKPIPVGLGTYAGYAYTVAMVLMTGLWVLSDSSTSSISLN